MSHGWWICYYLFIYYSWQVVGVMLTQAVIGPSPYSGHALKPARARPAWQCSRTDVCQEAILHACKVGFFCGSELAPFPGPEWAKSSGCSLSEGSRISAAGRAPCKRAGSLSASGPVVSLSCIDSDFFVPQLQLCILRPLCSFLLVISFRFSALGLPLPSPFFAALLLRCFCLLLYSRA